MNEITKEKLMSTREVAESLNTSPKVILSNARKCLPNKIIENGKTTYWTNAEVTILLERLKTNSPNQHGLNGAVKGVSTDLTPALKIKKAMELMAEGYQEELDRLKAERDQERQARIQAENTNLILMHVNKTYTASEIAKEIGFRSAIELNKWLEEKGIQYKANETWLPRADYSNRGFFIIKQEILDNGKVVYHRRITQLGREFILGLKAD